MDEGIYKTIFEISPEAIVLIDHKGKFVAANGRILDWLGYDPDGLKGKSLLQAPFLPRQSKVTVVRNFMRRLAGRDIPPYELEFVTIAGEKRFGRVHAAVVRDETGIVRGDLVMISDVTDLKSAERKLDASRRKIEGLHETARELLGCSTREEVCQATVDATVRVLGYQTCVA